MARSKKEIQAQKNYRIENPCCVICGNPSGTTHHIIPRSLGGTCHVNNFITLCREHHDYADTGDVELYIFL
jgi:5-methylcytosine-specific restriction endonuclease McrA